MNHPGNGIPAFDENGNLPPGTYKVTLEDIKTSLTGSKRRQDLFIGLEQAVNNLKVAGVLQIYIDGSFTTNKNDPDDIDGCWVPNINIDMKILDFVFWDRKFPRQKMKDKYGVDFMIDGIDLGSQGCPIREHFQKDKDENLKGILLLEL